MQQHKQDLVVLVASVNMSHTPQLHYGLVVLSDNSDMLVVKSFHLLSYNTFYSKADEAELMSLKFVLSKSCAYVYSSSTIYPVILLNGKFLNKKIS